MFLGFSFSSEREPRRRIAPKPRALFKERIRGQTRKTRGTSLQQMVKQITTYLRGWLGYFGACRTPSVLHLETSLRRRLRSVVWKQWKRGRTGFRELRKRGVSKDLTAKTARSSHGPWRLANSPALNIALPQCLLCRAQTSAYGLCCSIRRTAVCGPPCTVVWQGRVGDHSPYADPIRLHFLRTKIWHQLEGPGQ